MSSTRIAEFDLWRAGYGDATVNIYLAGTTTLAPVFTDEALTAGAPNPQILATQTLSNVTYGKFYVPIYIGVPYELHIVSGDQTGVIRPPLTTLVGEAASKAVVLPTGGVNTQDLDDLLGRVFYVEDTAALGVSAATNSATITSALGRAAAAGGGRVMLPDNAAIVFNQLTLPDGVILCGRGRSGLPTVLQSQVADKAITLSAGSGLENVVVDGVNKVASGIGLYSKAKNETYLHNVLVKRFETGLHQKGGRRSDWQEFYIDTCSTGAKLQGNLDTSGGDQWRDNKWLGGKISNCTTFGMDLSYEDLKVQDNEFSKVGFEDNTGTALNVNGARVTSFPGCWFSGNTVNFNVHDDTLSTVTDNTIIGFSIKEGSIAGGSATFNGACANVTLDRVALTGVAFTFTNVASNILFKDCTEDSAVTLSGTGTRVVRQISENGDYPSSAVVTTDAAALKSWSLSLQPGQRVWLEAKVIGSQRNGVGYGFYHITRAAHRPGSNLLYKAQAVNFTIGAVLTGGTSGASGRIIGDTDAGVTGTLVLKSIVGAFLDNEPLTDSSGGAATCDGVLVPQNAALLGSTTPVSAAVETTAGFGADFGITSGNVDVNVTGDAAKTMDWTTSVQVSVN